MKERPIIFSGDMVRVILAGRKTQTRRLVKPIKLGGKNVGEVVQMWSLPGDACAFGCRYVHGKPPRADGFAESPISCPHGKPGDRLWVRETWSPLVRGCGVDDYVRLIKYGGDGMELGVDGINDEQWDRIETKGYHRRPSIHMPRWASRITLEITGVRAERLQAISTNDCIAEGVWRDPPDAHGFRSEVRSAFIELWNWLNAKRGYGWDTNRWVWVIEFGLLEAAQ